MDTYTVNRDGSGLRKLTDDEIKLLPPAGGDPSRDRRYTVYTSEGDIHIYDTTTGKIQQVTKTADQESNPHFLPDGKHIYFTRANNLYVLSLENGYLEQMTDIQTAAAAAAPATATAGWTRRRAWIRRRPRRQGGGGRAAAATSAAPSTARRAPARSI